MQKFMNKSLMAKYQVPFLIIIYTMGCCCLTIQISFFKVTKKLPNEKGQLLYYNHKSIYPSTFLCKSNNS